MKERVLRTNGAIGSPSGSHAALTVVLLYAAFATLWILLSDKVVEWLFDVQPQVTLANVLKGWAFIVVTSLLLYLLISRPAATAEPDVATAAIPRPLHWPLGIFCLCIVGLTAMTIVYAAIQERNEEGARLQAIAESKARQIEDWLQERNADARIIRETPLLREAYERWLRGDGTGLEAIAAVLREYMTNYRYREALMLDPGLGLIWPADGSVPDMDAAQRAAIQTAVDEDGVVRFGPIRPDGGAAALDHIIPLRAGVPGHSPIVMLRAYLSDHLDPLLEGWPVQSATAETLLLQSDGSAMQLLTQPGHGERSPAGTLLQMPIAATAAAGGGSPDRNSTSQITVGRDHSGVLVVAAVRPISGTDWLLVAKVDRLEVYSRIFGEIALILLAGLLLLALAAIAAHLVRRHQQLERLAREQREQEEKLQALTERERAQNLLRERDELLRQMSAMAKIGAWEFDPATGQGSWSEETARIHELDPTLVPSRDLGLTFYQGEDRQRIEAAVTAAVECATPYDLELQMVTARGNTRWVRTMGAPVCVEGRVVKVRGAIQDVTDVHVTREELRQARDRNQRYLDTVQTLMIALDHEGRIRMINRAGCKLLGYEERDLLGRDWFDTCMPELDAGEQRKLALARIRDGAPGSLELPYHENTIVRRDGARRLIGWRSAILTDEEGNPTGILGSGEDITERKKVEEALRRSEQRFRQMADTIGEVFWLTSPQQEQVLYVNSAVEKVWGISRDAIFKNPHCWLDAILPEDRPLTQTAMARLARGENTDLRYRIRRPDGSIRWIHDRGYAQQDADGRVIFATGVAADVTEQVTAEIALQKLSQAIEQSPDQIIITDTRGTIEYVNASFVAQTGYTFAEVAGRNVSMLRTGRTPREVIDEMVAAVAAGSSWQGTYCNRRRDGSEYLAFAVITPIRDVHGKLSHYVSVQQDVTDRERAREELDRYRHHLEEVVAERTRELAAARERADAANQAKGAFLARMSHEIRTPMNGIVGLIEVLERTRLTEYQGDLINTIRESAGTLLRIIEDILDFSKIEAGRMEIEKAPLSVADTVEGVCSSLAATALNRGVALDVFIDPSIPPRVLSDEVRLRQVVYNLVGNAIKFTAGHSREPGRVRVRAEAVRSDPLMLRVEVADNGIGMAPEQLDRLYQAFSQAEVSTTRRFGGTGLGLTICKRLVSLMNGDISVQSTSGAGSVFTVQLPLERAAGQPQTDLPDLAGVHCIVLDDGRIDAHGIGRYIEAAGGSVSVADNRSAALRLLAAQASPGVLVRHADMSESTPAAEPRVAPGVRQLLITRGHYRAAEPPGSDIVFLDGNAMRRRQLLRAVAVLVGRMSPEVTSRSRTLAVAAEEIAVPSVAEARADGRLILIAEDDPTNQKVILQQLRLLGYAAEVAANGREALRMWRGDRGYGLLLTDLHMPEVDGYALTQAIRQEEQGHRLPIVALTANALPSEARRARAAGMDDYLTKPVQLPRLQQTLQKHLPLPQSSPPAKRSTIGSTHADGAGADVDLRTIEELVGPDPVIVGEMLAAYREAAGGYVRSLRDAIAADDTGVARAVAHKLKSASRSVGAHKLASICAAIEQAGTTGSGGDVRQLLPEFENAYSRVQEVLQHFPGGV